MPIACSTTTRPAERVRADLLAVPVYTDGVLGPGAEVVDAALGGGLAAFMGSAGFTGKPGETLAVPATDGIDADAALLVGLGAPGEVTVAGLRRAAACVARRATKVASLATTLAAARPDDLGAADAAGAVAEGLALGAYQFLEYKSEAKPSRLRRAVLVGVGGAAVTRALERSRVVTDAVAWARDLVNEPASATSPADMATAARRMLAGKGVRVTVLSEAQIRAQRMGGLLGVGQGSARPPRFVKATYSPRGARSTLALVGKGVVFDSGGLSIKTASGMETMKTDMSGAAAVLAAMSTLRALGVRHRVVAYAPLVENMPSGTAIRPGDVLTIRDGTTVEVLNTDAEGRLILADALALAVSDRATAIVDLATLTGACLVALGDKIAGLMGNHDEWTAAVRAAADRAGEPVWPLPLPSDYEKLLDSEIADVRNISTSSWGGSLTAGLFLQRFVGDVPWAHLDIAGPARASSDDAELTKGGTGFGVRALVALAEAFSPPKGRARASRRTPAKRSPGKRPSPKSTARRSRPPASGTRRSR